MRPRSNSALSRNRSACTGPRGRSGKRCCALEVDFFFQQVFLRRIEKRADFLRGHAPPLRAARVLEVGAVGARGEMHAREQRAELGAGGRVRALDRGAGKARDERGRLAFQALQVAVGEVGDRRRAGNAVAREVRHQVEVERQLLRRQALEQGQHVAALGRGDEVVAVLDARLDRLAGDQAPDRVVGEPRRQLGFGDVGIDRQISRKCRWATSARARRRRANRGASSCRCPWCR